MKKIKIIIVEHDKDEQVLMKEELVKTGLFKIVAIMQNGDELMEWLAKNKKIKPDVILTDLNMPGKNGYDILEVRNNDPVLAHISVVITSASSSWLAVEKSMHLGALDYLIKPSILADYQPFARKLYDAVITKKNS